MTQDHVRYPIVKLDRRHKGYGRFTHLIDFLSPASRPFQYVAIQERHGDFCERRAWLWENFGPANEIDFSLKDASWGWRRDLDHCDLYLTDKTLSAYLLLWV